jgi:cell division protein FtsQ
MRELFGLAEYINGNKFWKAQIQQIYVNEDGDFELIPLVGSHVIVFGTFDKPDVKFSKLEALYRNGLSVKGWNTYNVINLKYENQVVTEKR